MPARESIEAARKRLDLLEVRERPRSPRALRRPGRRPPHRARRVAQRGRSGGHAGLHRRGRRPGCSFPSGTPPAARDLAGDGRVAGPRASTRRSAPTSLTVDPRRRGPLAPLHLVAHIPDPENRLTPGSSVEASVPLGKPCRGWWSQRRHPEELRRHPRLHCPDPPARPAAGQAGAGGGALRARWRGRSSADGALKAGDPVIVEGNERLFPDTPLEPQPCETGRCRRRGPRSAARIAA